MPIEIRELDATDREWARDFLMQHWGSTRVVSRGRLHQADQLPGLLASLAGVRAGLLNYRVAGGELEVVTLQVTPPRQGLGSRLLEAAREKARQRGCSRLWLITTNDNEPAQQFYERRGMRLVAIHRNALAESRRLKPEIPLIGLGGRPIEDELEYEYRL